MFTAEWPTDMRQIVLGATSGAETGPAVKLIQNCTLVRRRLIGVAGAGAACSGG